MSCEICLTFMLRLLLVRSASRLVDRLDGFIRLSTEVNKKPCTHDYFVLYVNGLSDISEKSESPKRKNSVHSIYGTVRPPLHQFFVFYFKLANLSMPFFLPAPVPLSCLILYGFIFIF